MMMTNAWSLYDLWTHSRAVVRYHPPEQSKSAYQSYPRLSTNPTSRFYYITPRNTTSPYCSSHLWKLMKSSKAAAAGGAGSRRHSKQVQGSGDAGAVMRNLSDLSGQTSPASALQHSATDSQHAARGNGLWGIWIAALDRQAIAHGFISDCSGISIKAGKI